MAMLKQPMVEKLLAMRLHGMAESLKAQEQDPAARELSFLERLGLLVDQQWNWRENRALGRRPKNAKLRTNACVEDIDYRGARGLDKSVIRALACGHGAKFIQLSDMTPFELTDLRDRPRRIGLIVPSSNTVMEPDFHQQIGRTAIVSTTRIFLEEVTR